MRDNALGAVVLAAGQSRRMGTPKMVLPWGNTTVIGQVVSVLHQAEVNEIVVVTGASHQLVEAALQSSPVRLVHNERYLQDYMPYSLQVGLSSFSENVIAALVVLGDQPAVETNVVSAVIQTYRNTQAAVIAPSYQMRRGHPWLVDRSLWPEIMELQPPHTLRDFMTRHSAAIQYISVQTDSILRDLDTPQDYANFRP